MQTEKKQPLCLFRNVTVQDAVTQAQSIEITILWRLVVVLELLCHYTWKKKESIKDKATWRKQTLQEEGILKRNYSYFQTE